MTCLEFIFNYPDFWRLFQNSNLFQVHYIAEEGPNLIDKILQQKHRNWIVNKDVWTICKKDKLGSLIVSVY